MAAAGYRLGELPPDSAALMARLLAGPTNSGAPSPWRRDTVSRGLSRISCRALPSRAREQVEARWGAAGDAIPSTSPGASSCRSIASATSSSPSSRRAATTSIRPRAITTRSGAAAWLSRLLCLAARRTSSAHAVVHMGKHGNLEWLPGKALALSAECCPEAVLGPLPHLYPFIVNDPGEGSQAKRRAAAVIIDHLTPPLTRAETYGPLARSRSGWSTNITRRPASIPRRCSLLRQQILELARSSGLDKDCGIAAARRPDAALGKLDAHLCELKELQIRDGLHVFGRSPEGEQLTDLLVALTRLPRGDGQGGDASLIRALPRDLGSERGLRSAGLRHGGEPGRARGRRSCPASREAWRSDGDTRRASRAAGAPARRRRGRARSGMARGPAPCCDFIAERSSPARRAPAARPRSTGLLAGLDGRFVAPGPSGAPTRGRLEVLPTGRNFYSVDTRAVPTPAAWQLGWKSASLLLERYRQEHGDWPRSLALSRLGHGQYAHRRRRHRPGAGADGRQARAGMPVSRPASPASRSCRSRSSTGRASM